MDPLPCPFCGGTTVHVMHDADDENCCAAVCAECGAFGPDVCIDDQAPAAIWRAEVIAAWNRRVTPKEAPNE